MLDVIVDSKGGLFIVDAERIIFAYALEGSETFSVIQMEGTTKQLLVELPISTLVEQLKVMS